MNITNRKTKYELRIFLFPFNERQLKYFGNEIDKAGGFHELMFKKNALERRRGMKFISNYKNKSIYRRKYLIGLYKPLRQYYDTEIPFTFWSVMYDMLQRLKSRH